MSKYYQINGLKVRISDHEPNFSMNKFRGENDIELYVKSADNQTLSIEGQLDYICEKKNLNISDFKEIINDWQDGTYDKNHFSKKEEEIEGNHTTPTHHIGRLPNERLVDYLKRIKK